MKTLDLFVLNFFRFSQARKLRLRLKQDHGGHVGTVDGVDEVCVAIQSIADELERLHLVRKRRVQRLQFIPLAGRRLRIVEIIHDLDNVGLVSPMELKMVLRLQLRGRPFVVVVEREWRPVEILSKQGPVNSLFRFLPLHS
jgi:hypothetical protein